MTKTICPKCQGSIELIPVAPPRNAYVLYCERCKCIVGLNEEMITVDPKRRNKAPGASRHVG